MTDSSSDGQAPAPPTASRATAFAPATVGNLICGFDVLGVALERPGDRVTVERAGSEDGPASKDGAVSIRSITGDEGRIPVDADRNSAGVAVMALLQRFEVSDPVVLDVEKGLPLSGGMGGSAASAVAAVVAADHLFELNAGSRVLLECALEGERAASGSAHADNVAPCIRGGIVLVRSGARRPVVSLPVPAGLSVALLHPRVELATRDARAVLPEAVPMADAIVQWGNTAALVAGLFQEDLELIADALVDRVAEPARAPSIPAFEEVRGGAMDAGAIGFGISGAGPSMMALCPGPDEADEIGRAMAETFSKAAEAGASGAAGLDADLYVSPIPIRGAHVVDDSDKGEDGRDDDGDGMGQESS